MCHPLQMCKELTVNLKPKSKQRTERPPLPQGHDDIALIDIHDLRALTRMSPSWIHDAVRKGEFPAPAIRESRCTRWKLSDVRIYLIERTRKAAADTETAAQLRARAKKASEAARTKRAGTAAATAE